MYEPLLLYFALLCYIALVCVSATNLLPTDAFVN